MYLNGMLFMLVLGNLLRLQRLFRGGAADRAAGLADSTAMAKFLLRGEVIE